MRDAWDVRRTVSRVAENVALLPFCLGVRLTGGTAGVTPDGDLSGTAVLLTGKAPSPRFVRVHVG